MQHLAADLARVDFHHHFALDPGPVSEHDRRRFRIESGWPYPRDRTPWTPELSLRAMDELGIQIALRQRAHVAAAAAETSWRCGARERRRTEQQSRRSIRISRD